MAVPAMPPDFEAAEAAAVSASGFVGRSVELARLRAAVDDAIGGRGRVLMLVGEPGIGKSRTAEELEGLACERGARVLSARCHDGGGAPPFWPWRQLVRAYLPQTDPTHLRADLGAGAVEMVRLVDELRHMLPSLEPGPEHGAPEEARFRLFDSFTRFLAAVARRQPLVLIIDDLHWADPPSLLLLQFVARELAEVPLLIAGAYREIDVQADPARGLVLASLSRERSFERIALHGFSAPEAQALLDADLGQQAPAGLMQVLFERTEGNPFFLREMARYLAEQGRLAEYSDPKSHLGTLGAPQSVRAVIHQRLDRLNAETRRCLDLGAVIGRDFDLAVVASLEATDTETILSRLTDAVTAGIVRPLRLAASGARFVHSLVREVLYEELPVGQRVGLHRRVGAALEQHWRFELDEHAAELALHFRIAAPAGEGARALQYCVRAAERAASLLAYEDAVASYEHALEVATLDPTVDARAHCDLLLGLGGAQAAASNVGDMRDTFRRAAEVARSLDDRESFARAAIGYARAPALGGSVDVVSVSLLEEALTRLPPTDSSLRAALLSILADALHHSPETYSRRVALCYEASAMARKIGDLPTLARTLYDRHHALFGPQSLADRLAAADELLHLAQQTGDRPMLLRARFWRVVNLLESARVAAAVAEIDALERLAKQLREPWHHWYAAWFRAAHALLEGRFSDGERLAYEAFTHGERVAHENALQVLSAQISMLRALQGRCAEMVPAIRELVDQFPAMAVWRCALAYHCSELGETAEAQHHFEVLACDGFAKVPRDGSWMISMTQLADVCTHLGDAPRAAVLYELLLPYADRLTVVDRALTCSGAGHRYLGVLATTMGRWSEARVHLDCALGLHRQAGMRPWVAITQLDIATLLTGHSDPIPDLAHTSLAEAVALAEDLGMQGLLIKADTLRQHLSGMPSPAAGGEATVPRAGAERSPRVDRDSCAFLKEGDFWTVCFGGITCRLKDARGLQYLAYLLRHPGRSFHVTELLSLAAGVPPERRHADEAELSLGLQADRLPSLDQQARAAYRQRLVELREELAEARDNNDPGSIERTEQEINLLVEELSGAARGSSAGERARVSVTKRLKAALQRIHSTHPDLARHLDATVKSGYFCSYTPDPRHRMDWLT